MWYNRYEQNRECLLVVRALFRFVFGGSTRKAAINACDPYQLKFAAASPDADERRSSV